MSRSRTSTLFRLGVAGIALCAMLGATGSTASAQVCSTRFPFGTAQLPASDFSAGHYGAELRYLYGGWEWPDFGLNVSVMKADRYVKDIAGLVRDCIGDLRHGRLEFSRHRVTDPQTQTTRDETDPEYFHRVFDELVDVRGELARIELNYATLLHAHAPLVPDSSIPALKTTVNDAVLRTLGLAANRSTGIGWVVVLMDYLDEALHDFTEAQTLTRMLINVYLRQFPALRDEVIAQMTDNTTAVLDEYGEFFSEERRSNLEVLLEELAGETEVPDIGQVIADLNVLADELQIEFDAVWSAHGPLREIASKLKFIFGSCANTPSPHPLTTSQYFGDLAVSTRIVQEGDDAAFCDP